MEYTSGVNSCKSRLTSGVLLSSRSALPQVASSQTSDNIACTDDAPLEADDVSPLLPSFSLNPMRRLRHHHHLQQQQQHQRRRAVPLMGTRAFAGKQTVRYSTLDDCYDRRQLDEDCNSPASSTSSSSSSLLPSATTMTTDDNISTDSCAVIISTETDLVSEQTDTKSSEQHLIDAVGNKQHSTGVESRLAVDCRNFGGLKPEVKRTFESLRSKNDCDDGNRRQRSSTPRRPTTTTTNRAHLTHTIHVQQRLFQQQLMMHYACHRPTPTPYTDCSDDFDASRSTVFEHHYEEIADYPPSTTMNRVTDVDLRRPSPVFLADQAIDIGTSRSSSGGGNLEAAQQSTGARRRHVDGRLSSRDVDNATPMEWVIKRRPDGTRHITRRPRKHVGSSDITPSQETANDVASAAVSGSRRHVVMTSTVVKQSPTELSNDSASQQQRRDQFRDAMLELFPVSELSPETLTYTARGDITNVDSICPIANLFRHRAAMLSVTII